MSDNIGKVLLVGTGYMGTEYIKVLDAMGVDSVIVGNRQESVDTFCKKTGKTAVSGGVAKYMANGADVPEYAIVAVNVESLYEANKTLLEAGVKNLLIEKPGVLSIAEMDDLVRIAQEKNANVYIAYNRRFYASVQNAKRIIDEDGGLMSFNFEFTEWTDKVQAAVQRHTSVGLTKLFLGNSSHVADMSFYFGGFPVELDAHIRGGLDWHKAGSVYVGSGITEKDIPFAYQANWEAPGRWGVELQTRQHRLYLRPLEKLQIQNKNSVAVEYLDIDDHLDLEYKPGVYNETKAFLYGEGRENLCTLQEQRAHMDIYAKISGEKY